MLKISSLLTIFASLTIYSGQLQAQTPESAATNSEKPLITFVEPDYTEDAPAGRERGTGSRSVCSASNTNSQNLTINALTPNETRGLTTKEHPTLWINVQYPQEKLTKPILAQFSLEDVKSNTKVIKDIPVELPLTSSTVKVEIPHSLEVGKWYRWYLVVDCSTMDNTQKNTVISTEGLIQRQQAQSDINKASSQQASEEIAKAYAQKGIWYDALDEAAQLKCHTGSNSGGEKLWKDLLTQVNLENLAVEPLVCTPGSP